MNDTQLDRQTSPEIGCQSSAWLSIIGTPAQNVKHRLTSRNTKADRKIDSQTARNIQTDHTRKQTY